VHPRFGFVSTYPPTVCGLATFTASLVRELSSAGSEPPLVVRLVDGPVLDGAADAQLVAGDGGSMRRAVDVLNDRDVAVVQHEYGVYGGPDGDEVLALLAELTVPVVVVLHTVLSQPTVRQRWILEAAAAAADAVVVMTDAARLRLGGYDVDLNKVDVVPHGAPPSLTTSLPPSPRAHRPVVLTWGLIGPGKGIEWAIAAMALLRDVQPAPRYVVAGRTHPKVLAHEGEAYRRRLQAQVDELGLGDAVELDDTYRDDAALAALVAGADAVLLPYDSTEQVTSGVLIEAVVAAKPVIATCFPHAAELLSDGVGLVVSHKDPEAIAIALRLLLADDDLGASLSRAAAARAPHLLWPAVAARYRGISGRLARERAPA
jgi:polysaccharide biosynthesis protein PslF